MTVAVGIDLGTSNSAVAIIEESGRPRIFTTADGATTMPSIVWFSSEGIRVGEPALPGLEQDPEQTIVGVKRLLGRPFDHPIVAELAATLPYRLVASSTGDTWIALGDGRRISPSYVAALILLELKRTAESALGETVSEAVITVPAWYDSAQRLAVRDAAVIAGLSVRRLLSEPTAAALGYGAHRGHGGRYIICDLGGGTFDVAVVDIDEGVFEVLATSGDPFLGGDDVDQAMVEQLTGDVRTRLDVDISTDAVRVDRLRVASRGTKHLLSNSDVAELVELGLAQQPSGKPIDYRRLVARVELEGWVQPLLQRLEAPCLDALAKASRSCDDIDHVLLVGGMTRMPAVRSKIAEIMGCSPRLVDNPDEVVAIGAAIEVARLAGDISGVLLIDVCARGFAISMGDGPCELVIAASAVVPTREHRVMATAITGQRTIEFDLWEGESTTPSGNRHLARYVVGELPIAPAGDVLVVVELTVDVDGVVRIAASELVSGERPPVTCVAQSGLSQSDVERLRLEVAALPG